MGDRRPTFSPVKKKPPSKFRAINIPQGATAHRPPAVARACCSPTRAASVVALLLVLWTPYQLFRTSQLGRGPDAEDGTWPLSKRGSASSPRSPSRKKGKGAKVSSGSGLASTSPRNGQASTMAGGVDNAPAAAEEELGDVDEEADGGELVQDWVAVMQAPQDLVVNLERLVGGKPAFPPPASSGGSNVDGPTPRTHHGPPLEFRLQDPRSGGHSMDIVQLEPEFLPVIPERDLRETAVKPYGTCAVVGNSGTLRNQGQGAAIDKHDAVIRINYAPTTGYTWDVGQKVTFDLVNKENALKLAKGLHPWRPPGLNSTVLVFETASRSIRTKVYMKLLQRFHERRRELAREKDEKCSPLSTEALLPATCAAMGTQPRMMLVSPTLVSACRAVWNSIKQRLEEEMQEKAPQKGGASGKPFAYHAKPMSGMVAVYFAVQLCDVVSLYGFEPFRGGANQRVGYHYFDSRQGMTKVHSFDLAIDVFKTIATKHPLQIHVPRVSRKRLKR